MPVSRISFYYQMPVEVLRNRGKLKRFLARIFVAERTPLDQVSVVFCSDNFLLKINKKYLGRQYFTDTISFTLSDPGKPVMGEIYISYDRIRVNARVFYSTYKRELHRVIFHSALHLCGYSDNSPRSKEKMSNREDYWLSKYFD